jgi:hypothetical protein
MCIARQLPWLRQIGSRTYTSSGPLVAGFPLRRPGFESGSSRVGSVVDRAALRQVFSEYLGFTCYSFIPLIATQSSPSIIQGWYSRPIYDRSNIGLGSTPAPQVNKEHTGSAYSSLLTLWSWPCVERMRHCAMKTFGGGACIDRRFLALGTGWRWAISFRLLHFTPVGRATELIGWEGALASEPVWSILMQ